MEQADLIEHFEDAETNGLFPSVMTPTRPVPFLGSTWMDDLCITISASTAQAIETKTGVACGILLDACQRMGSHQTFNEGKVRSYLLSEAKDPDHCATSTSAHPLLAR